jgi:hypothetical protein
MADILNHFIIVSARAPEKPQDVKLLVSVGLLAVVLMILALASLPFTAAAVGAFTPIYPPLT